MKLTEQQLLEYKIKLEELKTKREMMETKNAMYGVVYTDEDFNKLEAEFKELREHLIWMGEK